MSLLNDALRGAEKRQHRPEVPAAYPGQSLTGQPSSQSVFVPWLIVLALTAMVAALVLVWLWLTPFSSEHTVKANSAATNELARQSMPDRDVTTTPAPITPVEPDVEADTAPKPVVVGQTERSATISRRAADPVPTAVAVEAGSSENTNTSSAVVATPELEPAQPVVPVPEPAPAATDKLADNNPLASNVPSDGQVFADEVGAPAPLEPTPSIKQQRDTPEVVDRRAEESIRSALASGRQAEAEQMLTNLLSVQAAPQSRARLARYLLVDKRPGEALNWLPDSAARTDDTLRLLRSRALLATGQQDEAVFALEYDVPPVREHVEYTVTLATLLQQQGRFSDAAGRWGELIAYDSSRAAWWVGLAIALEADQQTRSAARAYQQAMALSDLPPSLSDYVRRRLSALGAG